MGGIKILGISFEGIDLALVVRRGVVERGCVLGQGGLKCGKTCLLGIQLSPKRGKLGIICQWSFGRGVNICFYIFSNNE